MGADIYLSVDEATRKRIAADAERGGPNPLPSLPGSRLFGLGAFPVLLDAVVWLQPALRGEARNEEESGFQRAYLDLIATDREAAMAPADDYAAFVGRWSEFAEKSGRFKVLTPGGESPEYAPDGVVDGDDDSDARVFWGKVLFTLPLVTPEACERMENAVRWVYITCTRQYEALAQDDQQGRRALNVVLDVTENIGIHLLYVVRYGGTYVVSL